MKLTEMIETILDADQSPLDTYQRHHLNDHLPSILHNDLRQSQTKRPMYR